MKLETLVSECTAYDFKLMLEEKKPKSWQKSVSAFVNSLGDSLFGGIDNDRDIKGLDDVQHVCEAICSKIRDNMNPLPKNETTERQADGVSEERVNRLITDFAEALARFAIGLPVMEDL